MKKYSLNTSIVDMLMPKILQQASSLKLTNASPLLLSYIVHLIKIFIIGLGELQ